MIANADAARIPLPDKNVHCTITSPPYFGPRKYAGEQARDWPAISYSPMPGLPPLTVPAMRCELGREKTPEAYTAHLVLCFREVWRVLRDDGTCWVVEGDSYGGGNGGNATSSKKQRSNAGSQIEPARGDNPGQLLAIPYRLLLALQADGWLVRNDVVWSKVAPMPESVSGTHWERHQIKIHRGKVARQADMGGNGREPHGATIVDKDAATWADCPGCPRCSATGGYVLRRGSWRHTRSHETVLMLTKGMGYYSDQERVREHLEGDGRKRGPESARTLGTYDLPRSVDGAKQVGLQQDDNSAGRNPRDVLTPAPSPFKGEHYAAFPPDLIRPLILSSAPLKCCPVCGAGWAPIVEREAIARDKPYNGKQVSQDEQFSYRRISAGVKAAREAGLPHDNSVPPVNVIGYRPTCACNAADWLPGLVLDPFAGSGTTGLVCRELGLRFIGLDISGEYLRDIALVRSERLTPNSAMVNLPLFELLQS